MHAGGHHDASVGLDGVLSGYFQRLLQIRGHLGVLGALRELAASRAWRMSAPTATLQMSSMRRSLTIIQMGCTLAVTTMFRLLLVKSLLAAYSAVAAMLQFLLVRSFRAVSRAWSMGGRMRVASYRAQLGGRM